MSTTLNARRRRRLITVVSLACGFASAALPAGASAERSLTFRIAAAAAPAAAGAHQYTIYSCDADAPAGVPAPSDPFASAFPTSPPLSLQTRGMLSDRAGRRCTDDAGLRGLVTMNAYRRGGTVPKGTRGYYVAQAPAGATFTKVRWDGSRKRRDCRWTLQAYTTGPGGAGTKAMVNKRGVADDCRGPARGQASGTGRRPRTYTDAVAGATRFVQKVSCSGNRGSKRCSNRAPAYVQTRLLEITVADQTPPGVQIAADNPYTQGAWVNGNQPVNYTADDNTGVKNVQAYVDAARVGAHSRDCNYRGLGGLVPCPNGPGSVSPPPADRLPEGTHTLGLAAIDSANNLAVSNLITVRVDRTAPGAVGVGVAGGEGWRSGNDFDLSWTNPAEGDRAPITAANYRLCQAGGQCVDASRTGEAIAALENVAVPAEGEWQLRMWRTDAAGNSQPANASPPATLRLDSTPPELGFEPTAAADPTLLAVQVNDKVSGLAGGQIEISPTGSGNWQQLATEVQGSRLLARVDDSRLAAGSYQVRAFARDQANNQAASDRRLDGQPMTIQVPLRIQTWMRAGFERRKTITRRVKRHGKRRRVRRRVTVLAERARVRFGRQADIAGQLTNSDGQPVPGAQIQVYSRTETTPEQLIATLTTGQRGRYRYRARGSSTRTLRFSYPGSPQILPTQREVKLLVPAASGIRVRPKRTVNGRKIRFRGRLRAPFAGKLVELQARLPGRWQTFRTIRTGAKGVWKARYRFGDTCGRQRYRFRARLPKQAGYPYETGRTRTVAVRVQGRPDPDGDGRC
jgi:hypothetical protein